MLPAIRRNGSLIPPGAPTGRLSSLFDRFFDDDWFAPLTASAPAWSGLPLSMWEDEHNVYVELDAPGVTDKDVEVSVHNGDLLIKGERKCERKEGCYDT